MKTNILILGSIVFALSSCYKEQIISVERPEGWGYLSHSDKVDPDYLTVFDQNKVSRVDIVFESDDWQTMQDDIEDLYGGNGGGPGGPGGGSFSEEKPVMVMCQWYFNGGKWTDVGIRYKGNSSLSSGYNSGNGKLPFRVDFDHFEDVNPLIDDQRFYGFKELSISSNFDDVSLLHEKVATDMFRLFGVPAPISSFYEIWVDMGNGIPVYFGLYTNVEVVFDTMLKDRFGSESGNCYKPDGDAAQFANGTYDITELEKKTNELSSDWSDVEALYDIMNSSTRTTDIEQWKTDLELVFNVDGYLKYLAANTTMQNWDTYGNMTHNFFLYNDPATGLLNWIPWDNNEALSNPKNNALDFDFASVNSSDWPLIGYVYDVPEYKTIYDNYVDAFIVGPFSVNNVSAMYQNYHDMITPSAEAEISGYTYITNISQFYSSLSTQNSHNSARVSAAAAYTP